MPVSGTGIQFVAAMVSVLVLSPVIENLRLDIVLDFCLNATAGPTCSEQPEPSILLAVSISTQTAQIVAASTCPNSEAWQMLYTWAHRFEQNQSES